MANDKKNKDREMAAYLKSHGRPYGVTGTTTHAPPVPPRDHVGSAAYRRRRGSK